jgi:dimeric dUTPase (all-alpha-NTP-PPase superfamily)
MSDAKDMLQDLFDKQMALNRRIGVNPPDMNDEEKVQWVLNYTRAASQELAELVDSVPWKWWAKYQEFDVQNAKVEVVDLFHFLISLAQVLGMDAADVHDLYNQKNKLNFKRQDDGYATKDEDDNRSLNVDR